MEKYVMFVLCVTLSSTVASPTSAFKRYRSDYEYNGKTDAFYKLHIEAVGFQRTRNLCGVEGAELMIPASDHDITQLHSMFNSLPDIGDYVWVGNDGQRHDSVEEQPITDLSSSKSVEVDEGRCHVATRKGDIKTMMCSRELPFICKVAAKDAPYNNDCGAYGKDYKYYSSVGSCYKIPRVSFTWSQAHSECSVEGGHLVVVDSKAEQKAVLDLMRTAPRVQEFTDSRYFFAGFKAYKPTGNATAVFKTIFGDTLDEAGYSEWLNNEPNNLNGREYCGSIFIENGKLNDVDCSYAHGFICEKHGPTWPLTRSST